MWLLVYHIPGKIIEGILFTRDGSPFNAATYENQLNWPINLMNNFILKMQQRYWQVFILFSNVQFGKSLLSTKIRVRPFFGNVKQFQVLKFSLIRVRIWQKDPLEASLALTETWLWRMASSNVERHIAMAEIVDLTGSCLYWGERLKYLSCICGTVDDIGHISLLVFITGIIVV